MPAPRFFFPSFLFVGDAIVASLRIDFSFSDLFPFGFSPPYVDWLWRNLINFPQRPFISISGRCISGLAFSLLALPVCPGVYTGPSIFWLWSEVSFFSFHVPFFRSLADLRDL